MPVFSFLFLFSVAQSFWAPSYHRAFSHFFPPVNIHAFHLNNTNLWFRFQLRDSPEVNISWSSRLCEIPLLYVCTEQYRIYFLSRFYHNCSFNFTFVSMIIVLCLFPPLNCKLCKVSSCVCCSQLCPHCIAEHLSQSTVGPQGRCWANE